MNYENKNLTVFSERIAEILIMENGLKSLLNVAYLPERNVDTQNEGKKKKVYIFDNTSAVLDTFKKYAFRDRS